MRAVGQVALVLLLADRQAEVGPRVEAVDALAALGREEGDDVVAGRERARRPGRRSRRRRRPRARAPSARSRTGRRRRRCRGRCGRRRRRPAGPAPRPPAARRARPPGPRAAAPNSSSTAARIFIADLPRPGSIALEAGGLLGAAGRVALAVGVRAGAGELAAVDDQVLLADRPAVEPALEDLARAGRVARLRGEATCPTCAASCRGGASSARGGRAAPAGGTRRRRRSPPAGRSRSARTTASRSQILPRAVLTR